MTNFKYTVYLSDRQFDGTQSSEWGPDHPAWIAEEIAATVYGNFGFTISWPICIRLETIGGESLGLYSIGALQAPVFHAVKLYEPVD